MKSTILDSEIRLAEKSLFHRDSAYVTDEAIEETAREAFIVLDRLIADERLSAHRAVLHRLRERLDEVVFCRSEGAAGALVGPKPYALVHRFLLKERDESIGRNAQVLALAAAAEEDSLQSRNELQVLREELASLELNLARKDVDLEAETMQHATGRRQADAALHAARLAHQALQAQLRDSEDNLRRVRQQCDELISAREGKDAMRVLLAQLQSERTQAMPDGAQASLSKCLAQLVGLRSVLIDEFTRHAEALRVKQRAAQGGRVGTNVDAVGDWAEDGDLPPEQLCALRKNFEGEMHQVLSEISILEARLSMQPGGPVRQEPLWEALRDAGMHSPPINVHVVEGAKLVRLVDDVIAARAVICNAEASAALGSRQAPAQSSAPTRKRAMMHMRHHFMGYLQGYYGSDLVALLVAHGALEALTTHSHLPRARLFAMVLEDALPEAACMYGFWLSRVVGRGGDGPRLAGHPVSARAVAAFLRSTAYAQPCFHESGPTARDLEAFAAWVAARCVKYGDSRATLEEAVSDIVVASVADFADGEDPGKVEAGAPPEPRLARMARLLSWTDERQSGRVGLERFRSIITGSVAPSCPEQELALSFRQAALVEPDHGMAVPTRNLVHAAALLELRYGAGDPRRRASLELLRG